MSALTLTLREYISEWIAEGYLDFGTDTFKLFFVPAEPDPYDFNLTDLIIGGNYTTPSNTDTMTLVLSSSGQTAGKYSAIFNDLTITATAGGVGNFRYLVVYDDDYSDYIIGWYDMGELLTMSEGDSLTLNFDNTNGLLSIEGA